jgi:hypothetical protein
MVDSFETWGEHITEQKDADPVLIVDTTSKAGGWVLWKDIVARAMRSLERLWSGIGEEYDDKVKERVLQDDDYYRSIAILFQYGSILAFLGDTFGYTTVDSSKQIVDSCQVVERTVSGQVGLRIHGATLESDNTITRLSALEFAEFEFYMDEMKPCGKRTQILDAVIGNVILDMDVYYDPIKLNADGSEFTDASSFPILDAIREYQNEYVNKNAKFSIAEVLSRVSDVDGVEDVDFTKHRYDAAGGTSYTEGTAHEIVIDKLFEYLKAGVSNIVYISI